MGTNSCKGIDRLLDKTLIKIARRPSIPTVPTVSSLDDEAVRIAISLRLGTCVCGPHTYTQGERLTVLGARFSLQA